MKLLLVLCAILVVAASVPPPVLKSDNVQVLKYDNDNAGLGSYSFSFEQSDGTKQEQVGEIQNEGQENEHLAVRGVYSWVGPDGVKYIVTYLADENGFQPEIEQGPGGGVPPGVVASLLG